MTAGARKCGIGDAATPTPKFTKLLAAKGGSALVGFDGGTAQDILDSAKPMGSYAALRVYAGRATGVRITAARLAGNFQRDDADAVSADNGGTVIVDASGRRWKRTFAGEVYASWFGTYGDGTHSDSAALQSAVDYVGDKLELLFDPMDTHLLTAPIVAAAKLNARSQSVKGLLGTTVFDGSGLADGETCLYLGSSYSQVRGIKFLGKGRLVNGISAGRLVGAAIYSAHASVIESCEFVQCKISIVSSYACHVRVESCKYDACWKGIELSATSNTWKIEKPVFFNFLSAYSHSCVHVIDADQVTLRDVWSELNSVPVIIAERFSNIRLESSWIEHLVIGNAQPLFIVNGSAIANPYNFVVEDTDLVTNYPVIATLKNLQNFELRNIRQAGLREPNVLGQINCDTVDLVRMAGVYSEYIDNPATSVNRVTVTGANKVERDDLDANIVPKAYTNQVLDSSFKTIANTVAAGDAVITLDATVGVHDGSSMKVAFGAAGTGTVRTANTINVVVGQHVRLSAYIWTDSDTELNQVALKLAGITAGKSRKLPLTKTPRRFDLTWQVPAGGAGYYYPYFNFSVPTVPNRAYNIWVDDVQVIVDAAPIPFVPYVMNNSLTAAMKIGAGVNLAEHTLMGRKITSATAAPTAGAWAKGDIVYSDSIAAGGNIGWVCTTAGSPGTWKTFGAIAA